MEYLEGQGIKLMGYSAYSPDLISAYFQKLKNSFVEKISKT